MTKITRNSYKRKLIIGGVLLFMIVALVSTGFAAWVISKGDAKNSEGNIVIGTVEDGSVELRNVQVVDGKTFVFDCKADDTTGRITFREKNAEKGENLSIKITGQVKPKEAVDSITVKLNVPASVKAAADANYIVLPACANSEVSIPIDGNNLKEAGDGWYSFEYTITFEWGTKFGGKNPGEYYDEGDGAQIPFETVQSDMETFRTTLYGEEGTDHLKYTIVVTARAKG